MIGDEPSAHLFVSRAKYAAAFRRISRSIRSSRFSLRSRSSSARSSGSRPDSASGRACLTHAAKRPIRDTQRPGYLRPRPIRRPIQLDSFPPELLRIPRRTTHPGLLPLGQRPGSSVQETGSTPIRHIRSWHSQTSFLTRSSHRISIRCHRYGPFPTPAASGNLDHTIYTNSETVPYERVEDEAAATDGGAGCRRPKRGHHAASQTPHPASKNHAPDYPHILTSCSVLHGPISEAAGPLGGLSFIASSKRRSAQNCRFQRLARDRVGLAWPSLCATCGPLGRLPSR